MKKVVLLGCTGSVGENVLAVLRIYPDRFRLAAVSAHSDWRKLKKIVTEFDVGCYALSSDHAAENQAPFRGRRGLLAMVRDVDADIVVNAISGSAGLMVSVAALAAGRELALANKESLVVGGCLLTELARKQGKTILPVDSEHAALFALFRGRRIDDCREIILTASGGALRDTAPEKLADVTPRQTQQHPTWRMGAKINVDSATMANKGLEVMEAHYLFAVAPRQIKVVLHRQSLVHAFVRENDGALYCHLAAATMQAPVLQALSYPDIIENPFTALDLPGLSLSFETVDNNRYPLLPLAYQALAAGGSYPLAYNYANEAAVHAFLEEKIAYPAIAQCVETLLQADWGRQPANFAEILFQGDMVRRKNRAIIDKWRK